jgi:ABC-2 type transport system ATP-binding protein
VIRLHEVSKRYGRGPFVVSGVSMDVRAGEPLVVHGANGTGKSTLLRIVAGCLAPTHGRVSGRPATVGYLPDRFPARLRMPADVYLRHLGRIRPVRRPGPDPVELLARLGFRGGVTTHLNRLSKGNAQKVGLAQALCSGAPLLVLDEPWSGLDADARPGLTAAVGDLLDSGTAVVLADHTRTAETLRRHRAVVLSHGQLAEADDRTHTARITLRCAEPAVTAPRLAGFGAVEQHPGGLVLTVAAHDVDALLVAALRLGCSVREVRECAH